MTIQLTLTPAQNQWLEATWTEVTQAPDVVTPAVDAVLDDEGNEVTPAQPEVVTPGQITRTELKHVSYHPTQLPLLQADAAEMGTPLDSYVLFLSDWVDSYVPPEPEPVVIPEVLTARQAKLVLLSAGLLDDVDAAVAASDRATQIEWEYATEIRRNWPTLLTMTEQLGMTSEQLDTLFIEGSKL